jgi:hypothetical protein
VPSGYEPTREPLLKWMFFGECARNEREKEVLRYVIDRMKKDVPRADAQVSAA